MQTTDSEDAVKSTDGVDGAEAADAAADPISPKDAADITPVRGAHSKTKAKAAHAKTEPAHSESKAAHAKPAHSKSTHAKATHTKSEDAPAACGMPIPPKGDSREKDFSNPHHLGFMRFIMVIIALQIFFTLVGLSGAHKGDIGFSFDSVLMFIDLLFNAVLFWLMWQRRAHTRAIAITFSALNIVAGTSYNIATGNFDLASQIFLSFYDVIIICYFATSRRARAVLVRPWTQAERKRAVERDIELFRPRELEYWRNLAIYFCVFSVVGHWMEAGYCTLIRFGLLPGVYDPNSQIWSDWLYPFMVYGIGFVVCALVFFPLKNWLQKKIRVRGIPFVISFIVNAVVCAGIELAMGLMLNQPLPDGSLPLWDYRSLPFNFMGQICLANAIAFGVAASVITWFVYPALEGLLVRMPKDTVRIISVVVFVGFAFLLALYYIKLPTLYSDSGGADGGGGSGISVEVGKQDNPGITIETSEQDSTSDSPTSDSSAPTSDSSTASSAPESGAESGAATSSGADPAAGEGGSASAGDASAGDASAGSTGNSGAGSSTGAQ